MKKIFESTIEVLDKGRVFRRIAFIWILVLTSSVFNWAMLMAAAAPAAEAVGVAALIAAVTGPLALLQGAVFKIYSEYRLKKDDSNGHG